MKTSLSAALFSLPETTNSAETGGRKERALPPGPPLTSCADETIGGKGRLGSGRDGLEAAASVTGWFSGCCCRFWGFLVVGSVVFCPLTSR